jgi:hypothetical protein
MDSTKQDLLNALRRRLTELNSQFREADNRLTEANIQTDIWNVLTAIAILEAELKSQEETDPPKR